MNEDGSSSTRFFCGGDAPHVFPGRFVGLPAIRIQFMPEILCGLPCPSVLPTQEKRCFVLKPDLVGYSLCTMARLTSWFHNGLFFAIIRRTGSFPSKYTSSV